MNSDREIIPNIRDLVAPPNQRENCLSLLSDDQLGQIVALIKAHRTRDSIARTIREEWGHPKPIRTILKALKTFEKRLKDLPPPKLDPPELPMLPADATLPETLDVEAANRELIADLKIEWNKWRPLASTKAELEHLDRVGRLLGDRLNSHLKIQEQLKSLTEQSDEEHTEGGPGFSVGQLNVENIQLVITDQKKALQATDRIMSELETVARHQRPPQPKLLGTTIEAELCGEVRQSDSGLGIDTQDSEGNGPEPAGSEVSAGLPAGHSD